jgi:hypothetical protein
VQVFGFETSAHFLSDLIELDMDPMPFAVGVGTQFLFRRQGHIGGAMSLAHGLPP